MHYYKTTKKVIKLKNNIEKLLNGLSTNTTNTNKTAFLDVFGKIIVTCYQIKIKDDETLLIIEEPFFNRFKEHIGKYLKLTRTIIEETDYKVYATQGEIRKRQEDDIIIKDKSVTWLVTKQILKSSISEEEYKLWRVKNNIPLHGIDYDREMLLNINDEEYVSFSKGCYLGQEIIARVKNLGKAPKKLMIKNEDDCSEEEKKILTSKSIDPKTKKIRGFILVRNEENKQRKEEENTLLIT